MTDHRDPELSRRLAELGTAEHHPDFWAALRSELVESTTAGPDADPHLVEDDGVVDLAERRAQRLPGRRLAVAAVALVAVVSAGIVFAAGREADREADVATDPTVTEPTPDTVSADGPLRPVGVPIERGLGRPLAVDPTGTFLYVAAPAPGGGQGCEGAPAEAVFVERVDGDGSDRRLALGTELVDATGPPLIAFSDAGEVAFVPRCEGFGADIVTGTVSADGTISDPTQLSLTDVESILDVDFLDAGLLGVATFGRSAQGDQARRFLQLPTSPSEPTDLGIDGVVALDAIEGGPVATVSLDGTVRVDGDVVAEVIEPLDVTISPSGRTLVVDGTEDGGLTVVDLVTGEVSALEVGPPAALVDDDTVVAVYSDRAGYLVVSYDLTSGERRDLVRSPTGMYALAPGAGSVFVNGFAPEGHPLPLLEQRLTR